MDSALSLMMHESFAELLEKLGDIPPERIRLKPPPGQATADDAIHSKERYGRNCELFDGVLVEKPVGWYESSLAMILGGIFRDFLKANPVGFLLGADGPLKVDKEQVRKPDLSFYSWDHFPGKKRPRSSALELVPDLAVEVLSPSNTKREMERKRREYFLGGCKLVWEIDPEKRTVRVYTAPDESKLLREKGTLDGGEVLPGFTLKIADLFAEAGERED